MTTMVDKSSIDKEVLSILSEASGRKLLSFTEGIKILSLLLIYPSPQAIIKAIVSQRCTEDLITMLALLGPSLQIVQKNSSKKVDELAKDWQLVLSCFKKENHIFEKFIDSFKEIEKNLPIISKSVLELTDE